MHELPVELIKIEYELIKKNTNTQSHTLTITCSTEAKIDEHIVFIIAGEVSH